YGERCVAAKLSQSERQALSQVVGPDGQWLLGRLQTESTPAALRALPAIRVLTAVWEQQFEVVDGRVVFLASGPYGGATRVQTPHDPEARYSKKGAHEWIGYKVQVTETDENDRPHLITDIAATSSVETDFAALAPLQARLSERQVLPGEQFVDGGYVSESNLAESARRGIDLVGPAPEETTPQARMPQGLTVAHFQIDVQAGTAICPGGHGQHAIDRRGGRVRFRFPEALCAACPLRPRCCTGRSGRTLSVGQHYPLLRAARERQQTDDFKACYRRHRSGVEGTLSALVRGHGGRLGRYIGQAKRHLQAVFTGVAVNLRRAARWLVGKRPQVRRKGPGLAPAT
ncbi:MAG: transposase, partial [Anaerolineales bacterium]